MIDLGLTDKVALITGGTRGLGRAIAEKLAEQFYSLFQICQSTLQDKL